MNFKNFSRAQFSKLRNGAVACMLVMHRAQVQSLVGTRFLGEVFLGFFLTSKTNVRKL